MSNNFEEILEINTQNEKSKFDGIIDKIKRLFYNPIPPCLGYRDEWNGDYGCEYETEIVCEDCICNFDIGGTIDPRTGKRFKRIRIF